MLSFSGFHLNRQTLCPDQVRVHDNSHRQGVMEIDALPSTLEHVGSNVISCGFDQESRERIRYWNNCFLDEVGREVNLVSDIKGNDPDRQSGFENDLGCQGVGEDVEFSPMESHFRLRGWLLP